MDEELKQKPKNRIPTSTNDEYDEEFKKGGGIYINPKNKGKFTKTKQKTGKSTEELTHSKNPLTRKRAIFAKNAKRWSHKHEDGGNLEFLDDIINEYKHGGSISYALTNILKQYNK